MNPKVFLSHSKKDKEIIEKIANDLRTCKIDVWYDEWEISPGDSLRQKIFDHGISVCDVFFAYLTPNSVSSNWVQKELDSAMIRDLEERNSFLVLFVDSDNTRSGLPIDLRSLNIQVLNIDDYQRPLIKLISKVWQVYYSKMVRAHQQLHEQKSILIEIKNLELEKKLFNLEKNGALDLEKVKERLQVLRFSDTTTINKSYFQCFQLLKNRLAEGIDTPDIISFFRTKLGYQERSSSGLVLVSGANEEIFHFLGELIIQGLVKVTHPNSGGYSLNVLSEMGIRFARIT